MKSVLFLTVVFLPSLAAAFLQPTTSSSHRAGWSLSAEPTSAGGSGTQPFELVINMPGSKLQAQIKCEPALSVPSELVVVRYDIPFGLDVAPKKGLAVCNKDGPGGEKVGDILRYTSQWTLELPRGDGMVTTAASFAGGLSWQCSLFDVLKSKAWELVVEALVSNEPSRTDQVVLIFERSLGESPPELE